MARLDALEIRMALSALMRLYIAAQDGYDQAYPSNSSQDAETDEGLIIGVLERARNEWRPIRRRRSNDNLEARLQGDEPLPDTERCG